MYDYISGVHAQPDVIHDFMESHVWFNPCIETTLSVDKEHYIEYCKERLSLIEHSSSSEWADPIWRTIRDKHLTPVAFCHGDLTCENVILSHGEVKLIDPGKSRGLDCMELDESKILQSYDGWHKMKHGSQPGALGFDISHVHWALLATHYIRLACHKDLHPFKYRKWALDRARSIANEL